MLTVKAKIPAHADYEPILPLAVPDLKEVKAFANHLHSLGKHWQGEVFSWQAEYTPESNEKPVDSAMQFTRRRDLQAEIFQNNSAYIGAVGDNPDFVHLTPESSRRFRALPAWFTLMAYGAEGCREIVERDCAMAKLLGEKISASSQFRLLAPVRMNVACFTLAGEVTAERIKAYLAAVRETGAVFMTPTVYKGTPGIRAAISNWRTEEKDVEIAWEAMTKSYV